MVPDRSCTGVLDAGGLRNGRGGLHQSKKHRQHHNEEFDIITARAVANLGVISEISVRSLKVGGNLVFMKANCDEEINMIMDKLDKLGLEIKNINKFKLPYENSNRTLVSFRKIKKTNSIFEGNLLKGKQENGK